MALSDAHYRFLYVDVGTAGRWSDGGTYDHCSLSTVMENNSVGLPEECELPSKTAMLLIENYLSTITFLFKEVACTIFYRYQ